MCRLPIYAIRVRMLLAAIAFFFLLHAPAFSQDQAPPLPTDAPSVPSGENDLERRVRELEAALRQMREQSTTVPAGASAQSQPPTQPQIQPAMQTASPDFDAPGSTTISGLPPIVQAQAERGSSPAFVGNLADQSTAGAPFFGWRDGGFYLESADRAFILRITGQIQADYREFLNSNDRNDIDTFLLRRARFGLEATLFQYYEFRFLPDFGQGTTIIQDAYMNVHYCDDIQFEIGRFKQPVSYEQLIQDRFVPTLERSIIDQLVPARDLGAMLHGEHLFGDRLDWAISISNGEINGNNTDVNNHKDVDGRIAVRPLNSDDLPDYLRLLSVGVSGGFGIEQEPISPASLKMPDTVTFFTFNNGVRADGLRTRLCPELAYFYGPLGFLAQYYEQRQEMRPAASGPGFKFLTDVPFTGFVFLGTCLLTGETRKTYSEAITPIRPFHAAHPISCPGAWEFVARCSQLDVGDVVFAKGAAQFAKPAGNSDEATEFTLGFNWYWNSWVRVQFNYEHDMFAQPVLLGPSVAQNELKSQDSLFTRFQVIF